MPKFKAGDRVRRIDEDNGPIKVGQEYIVESAGPYGLFVKEHPDLSCDENFFMLVKEPVTKYLVMWTGDRTQMYDTLEFAKDAANGRPVFEVVAVHESKTEYVRREY